MTWNYRIMKSKCPRTGEFYYTLNEVFYHDDGKPRAYCDRDGIVGESPQEIVEVLYMMLTDAKKDQPVLSEEDFKVVDK